MEIAQRVRLRYSQTSSFCCYADASELSDSRVNKHRYRKYDQSLILQIYLALLHLEGWFFFLDSGVSSQRWLAEITSLSVLFLTI